MDNVTWEDWRGLSYMAGDTILYPTMFGNTCEITEAIVEELYEVYRDSETYKYVKVKPGVPVPEEETTIWVDPENPDRWSRHYMHTWERVNGVVIPVDKERRAKVRPTGATSRYGRYDQKEDGTYRSVVLRVVQSITRA